MTTGATSADPRRGPRATPDLSPSELGRLVEAKTIDAGASGVQMQTFHGAESDVKPSAPPPGNGKAIWAIGAVCILLGAGSVATFLMTREKPAVAQVTPPTPESVTPPMPIAPATPPTVVTQAAPSDVAVTVRCVPEHAAIYVGDEKIGTAPGPVKIKRTEKVKLTLKAEGYTPVDVEVEANQDNTVTVKLTKVATTAAPPHPKQPARPGEKAADAIETPTF
ncbi:MAG: PEGA domain-containing protein [Polyangiaceae bacterium]